MAYPERKPIYDTYQEILSKIIEENTIKSFTESIIDELDNSLLEAFKQIRITQLLRKKWPEE